ncbi:MAG TPA: universal stress protein [Methylomirabilota bacterium]|jgi:nucleotide-binding universal stress UspA family protein
MARCRSRAEWDSDPELLAEARKIRADAVVVGSRGAGAVKHSLLGSVAEGVLKHGTFDILIVK